MLHSECELSHEYLYYSKEMIINGVWIYYKTDVEQLSRGLKNTKCIVFGLVCSEWKKRKEKKIPWTPLIVIVVYWLEPILIF